MLEPVSNKVSFPRLEEDILRWWAEADVFRRSLEQRRGAPEYVFYDGPPFATGLPHYGHLLAGTIKDIVPRYHTMRGRYVERRFGWDCHGLPIEALAQERLGLSGARQILERGVDVFNETCRSMVLTYTAQWRQIVTRMGRWVDFDNDYKTMDLPFMETVWWVFKQLWDRGRIYRSYRIMPYSWKLSTPLSNFEAGRNYRDVQDPSITVRLRVRSGWSPPAEADGAPVYLLIWTTTPWTLPANLAVCAGPDIEYVAVLDRQEGAVYVLAECRLNVVYRSPHEYRVLARFPGRELAGWTYEPPFPWFEGRPGAFRVLTDPFVSTDEGTGIVHMAPAYGEDDFRVCRAAGIELVDVLDAECRFTAAVPDYAGRFCKDADADIIRRLKREGKLVHQSTIVHSYPFCERTDTPLIYRAIEAWYVRVEDLRDQLVANNAGVHWVPAAVGEKRFGNWLREAKDWNISRNRFWGSCIPVWIAEDGSDAICVGSIAELEALSGVRLTDLHKHHVDKVTFVRNGKLYRRTPEVLDCWFESGAMPWAQQHYPFERAEELDRFFPAEFIAEGLDQTRGWFYTLLVLSTALYGRSAYRNVIVNGLILAEDGRKMSKRLKNYPDPSYIMDTYGADALRLYLISSPVVHAEDLCFSEQGVRHALRELLIPIWNALVFLTTYARVDGWRPSAADAAVPRSRLDRWILSALDRLTQEVVTAMDAYDLQGAVRPFLRFTDELTNWYIRRSRRRFWKSGDDLDKRAAYATLYEVLLTFSRIAAPFIPFISEAIWRNLRSDDLPESVHLCDYPVSDGSRRDPKLERQMDDAMAVVSLGRQIRRQHDLKVRQPLAAMYVAGGDPERLAALREVQELIADELNVDAVRFETDTRLLARLRAKPNFRLLGPRLGPDLPRITEVLRNLDDATIEQIVQGGTLQVETSKGPVELGAQEILIERIPREGMAVAAEGEWVVALDTRLTPALIAEGLAREFVNRVQNLRKDADLDVAQRIRVRFVADEAIREAVERHADYIRAETLAVDLAYTGAAVEGAGKDELNGHPCRIEIEPVET
ncbi:MAG: isoleucine--tRNA ligase [Kiritimatiellae bacterium]|nr:isoleucine--tRNA ligase [Kiritimatiellia bacterium]